MEELSAEQQHHLERAAIAARRRAYAPYSQFLVGAAIWVDAARIVTAGNVENASYGLTLCAERAALVAALAQGVGVGQMSAMAIAADAPQVAAPCGACRQVLVELCPPEMPLFLYNVRDGARQMYTVAALVPHAFGPSALSGGHTS